VQAGLQQLALGFNAGLGGALDALDQLPGMHIARLDTFGLLTAISGNPGAFGLDNVTTPCLTGDPWVGFDVCATPESYLFWDTAHPSARGHMLLGDAFARAVAPAAVPEPALFTLLVLGVAARAAGRRRAS
jgi:outer membrane lipase/esterase